MSTIPDPTLFTEDEWDTLEEGSIVLSDPMIVITAVDAYHRRVQQLRDELAAHNGS
jgi:hypothetical protein